MPWRIADNTPEKKPGNKYMLICPKLDLTPDLLRLLSILEWKAVQRKETTNPMVKGTAGFLWRSQLEE